MVLEDGKKRRTTQYGLIECLTKRPSSVSICPGRYIAENFLFLWTSNLLLYFNIEPLNDTPEALERLGATKFGTNLVR